MSDSAIPWTAARQASLSITNSRSLLKLMSIGSLMPSNHLILCRPLLLLLSSFPVSGSFPKSQFFASDGQSIEASAFGISPSNEYLGLISFRIDWFDLAVQWTLKSLLQHHNSKASILWCLAFFMVHLSHWYMTTATAKSLQLCPTLCDPIDGSPPGSPIPGILQARILERVAISFSNA